MDTRTPRSGPLRRWDHFKQVIRDLTATRLAAPTARSNHRRRKQRQTDYRGSLLCRHLRLQVTFRDMPPSPAVEARVRDRVAALGDLYDYRVPCRDRGAPSAPSPGPPLPCRPFTSWFQLQVGAHGTRSRRASCPRRRCSSCRPVRDAFDAATRQLEIGVTAVSSASRNRLPHTVSSRSSLPIMASLCSAIDEGGDLFPPK